MSSLTRLLNIRHPIVQSGMGRVAGPDLAGQSVGVIHDVPTAGDVVRTIAEEAEVVMRNLGVG